MNKTLLKYLIYITWIAWFIIGALNFKKIFSVGIENSTHVVLMLIILTGGSIRIWAVKKNINTNLIDDFGRILFHSIVARAIFISAVELYWSTK